MLNVGSFLGLIVSRLALGSNIRLVGFPLFVDNPFSDFSE